jgi:glycosyltransferase involved in cell wall biosynthesis
MNTSSPKVSVIIPCYNYAHYLKECVDSVKAQTYPVEIIVVDDGSPDNTMEVCKELGVTCFSKKNGGLGSARNYGIERATGEYIMCLDADDKLVPGAIEEHVKLMEDDITIAQCALMEFGERHILMLPMQTNLERVMQSNTIYCNAMFAKKKWLEVGGYDESETMRLGYEDWEFWLRLLAIGCHVNTSDFIALRYRCHQGQMTQATSHPNQQTLYKYIYEKHKDLYESKNLLVAGFNNTQK